MSVCSWVITDTPLLSLFLLQIFQVPFLWLTMLLVSPFYTTKIHLSSLAANGNPAVPINNHMVYVFLSVKMSPRFYHLSLAAYNVLVTVYIAIILNSEEFISNLKALVAVDGLGAFVSPSTVIPLAIVIPTNMIQYFFTFMVSDDFSPSFKRINVAHWQPARSPEPTSDPTQNG